MKNQSNNDSEWQAFLDTGKQVIKAVNSKEIIDVHQKLKSKYPGTPMPNPNRIIKTVSSKQQRAIREQGAR